MNANRRRLLAMAAAAPAGVSALLPTAGVRNSGIFGACGSGAGMATMPMRIRNGA